MRPAQPWAPAIPAAFASWRDPGSVYDQTYVSLRDGLGCFSFEHQSGEEFDYYRWDICFDERGVPQRFFMGSTGIEATVARPVALEPSPATATRAAAPPSTAPAAR